MPRKGRKSLTLWKECEDCKCTVNAKDLAAHTESCPPNEISWNHSFIKQKTLYTFIEDVDPKNVPIWMRQEIIEDVIFLSQSAMQICEFILGFPVLITISDKKFVKRSWPTNEGSLTSAILSKEDNAYLWDCKAVCNLITISKLPSPPKMVREIHYRIVNIDEQILNLDELSSIIRTKFKERAFYVGNQFHINFYGKKFLIKIMQCMDKVSDINEIGNISLEETAFISDNNAQWICTNKFKAQDLIIPEVKAIKFGGYDSIISQLKETISTVLLQTSKDDARCIGVLIYGINGSGKTLATQYLANSFNANIVNIQGVDMFSKYYGETEGKLRSSFAKAIKKTPSIIILDNIEVLCPRKGTDQERRIVSTFLSLFDSIQFKNIVVLATSSKPDSIDSSLRRPGRLEMEIEMYVPNAFDREIILNTLLAESSLNDTIKKLADISHGFVGADLASLVGKAQSRATVNGRDKITKDDLTWAHSQVMPSAMREVFVQVPNVKWSDIAGQDDLKLKLQQCIEWPMKYPESFIRLGIKAPRGVLMYGPPGCSKTLIAKAIATESHLNFLSVKGSDIFSKWVGESERAIRDIFKRARCVAPCIIFIDEVDALGGEREAVQRSGGSAVQERVLSQLLTEMDGVMPLENVIIVAATNRPDRIDKALLRPGRLDRIIFVPLPDYNTRKQLFELQFKKMPVESAVNPEELAAKTAGYSGAEIVAVCNEAAFKALEENMQSTIVKMINFNTALQVVNPRTPQSLLKIYEDYKNQKEISISH